MRRDDGSAVVEFVLVSVLVVFVVLAVCQLALALYVRNTLSAAATEGARFGAFADRSPDDAVVHTRRLIAMSLPEQFAQDVSAGREMVGGAPTVVVEVRADLPLVAWWGPAQSLVARGHAIAETP